MRLLALKEHGFASASEKDDWLWKQPIMACGSPAIGQTHGAGLQGAWSAILHFKRVVDAGSVRSHRPQADSPLSSFDLLLSIGVGQWKPSS